MLAGKRDVMSVMADGAVMQGGTMNSNVMSMAAAEASLNKLMADNGAVYKQLYSISNTLMEGLRALGNKHEIGMQVFGPGPVFQMSFTDLPEVVDYADLAKSDKQKYTMFYQGMLEQGTKLISTLALNSSRTPTCWFGCESSKAPPKAEAFDDPNRVKVVVDAAGFALYFSRAPIPFRRGNVDLAPLQHVGIYGYRRDFLLDFVKLPRSPAEQAEELEQLRALENGYRIRVAEIQGWKSVPVDVPEDVAIVEAAL